MKLNTLESFNAEVAGQILAELSLSNYRPNLKIGNSEYIKDKEVEAVRNEILNNISVSSQDHSMQANAKFSNAVFEAIKSNIVGDNAGQAAIERLGQKGTVPPHFYMPVVTEGFMKTFSGIGVKKTTVERAITEPDRVQHLWTEVTPKGQDSVISLFLKRQTIRSSSPAWLLVQTLRKGIQQIAQAAWYIFEDEIAVNEKSDLVDILEMFSTKHGFDIFIGHQLHTFGRHPKFVKFINQSVLDYSPNIGYPSLISQQQHTSKAFNTFSIQLLDETKVRAGIGYSIDMHEYQQNLRRHGIIS